MRQKWIRIELKLITWSGLANKITSLWWALAEVRHVIDFNSIRIEFWRTLYIYEIKGNL